MIDTVLFDMGGTLEEAFTDDTCRRCAAEQALTILSENGVQSDLTAEQLLPILETGMAAYRAYREKTCRELKPEEIWGRFVLNSLGLDEHSVLPYAEQLAHMWEIVYHRRSMREGVPEMLQGLQSLGMKLGIISNTSSLFQVFETLQEYGIRDYFQDVTLSSVIGYRKPDGYPFRIALYQVQSRPETSAYVGDTISRDVIGAQQMGFGMTFRIESMLSREKDGDTATAVKPTYTITSISEVYTILRNLREQGNA